MKAVIQNAEALAATPLRADALAIAEAGYAAVHAGAAFLRKVRVEDGTLMVGSAAYPIAGRRVYFVGVGKCAIAAAGAAEKLLGDALVGGIALDVSDAGKDGLKNIEAHIGTHPLPTDANQVATERVLEFLSGAQEDDLVLVVVSGGGSTLLCAPEKPMTCAEEGVLFTELTARGAPIQDINTVRKHTSRARGGGLAKAAYPAEVVALVISDVPGDDLAMIASGPTVRDPSTAADARAVLERYGLADGTTVTFVETPKEDVYFSRVHNMLFLSGADALHAMAEEAARRGYAVTVAKAPFSGEARSFAQSVVEELRGAPAQTALLYAGESTVTLSAGAGAGGRNQELSLAALAGITNGELVLPFASDGHDNTDHAGAIADATTLEHARMHGLSLADYLAAHRSYEFFRATGDALTTSYTGANVSDLLIALKQ